MARKRRWINISFWVLAGATSLALGLICVGPSVGVSFLPKWMAMALKVLEYLYSTVFVIKAHRKMNEVSAFMSASRSCLPPLDCRM